jgi:hypothetical protein
MGLEFSVVTVMSHVKVVAEKMLRA